MSLRVATQGHSLHSASTHDSFKRRTSHHTCNEKEISNFLFHHQLYDLRGVGSVTQVPVLSTLCHKTSDTFKSLFLANTQLILIWSDYFYVQLVSIHFCLTEARRHDQINLKSLFHYGTHWPKEMHFCHVQHKQAHSVGLESHT